MRATFEKALNVITTNAPNAAGVAVSLADIETSLRILAILVGIASTIYLTLRKKD